MKFKSSKHAIAGIAVLALVGFGATVAVSQDAPFGTDTEAAYAAKLWTQMTSMGLAGPDGIRTVPYEGIEPHGFVLETFYSKATVDGYTGDLIVKRNYGPEGVSLEEVNDDAAGHLGAITIMFKREAGYDPDNKNWFWAKYLPDGTLDKNPKGMRLAGRVAKGADVGCIACHVAAPGDNYLFSTNHIQ